MREEREILKAANEAMMSKWSYIAAAAVIIFFSALALGSTYYTTYVTRIIAEQKMELYKLCLENQKLAMTAAVDRRGYLSIPDCRI